MRGTRSVLVPLSKSHMQRLRSLRLAVRLGIAFGAPALGLVAVSVVAFKLTEDLGTRVDVLAVNEPRYTAAVDGLATRMPREGELMANHLYVFDRDLAAQDEVAKRCDALAAHDEKTFPAFLAGLRASQDPKTRAAAGGIN